MFRDQEFTSDIRSRPVKRIADVRALRGHQFVEDAGPLAHPVRPGGLSRDQQFLHRDHLREGRRGGAHAQDPARAASASAPAWTSISSAMTATPRRSTSSSPVSPMRRNYDLTQFMLLVPPGRHAGTRGAGQSRCRRQDLYARNHPDRCRRRRASPSRSRWRSRSRSASSVPTAATARSTLADGRKLERGVLTLTKAKESFVFTGLDERPVLSLNRGFSAPVKLTANLRDGDLAFLAAHDGDPFNRWQAVQTLATALLIENVAAHRAPARRCACADELVARARRHPRRPRPGARLRRPGDDAAFGRRHRPRDRPRRRSRRDLCGAARAARRGRPQRSHRRSPTPIGA